MGRMAVCPVHPLPITAHSPATILISTENSSPDMSLESYQQSYPRAIHANRGKLHLASPFKKAGFVSFAAHAMHGVALRRDRQQEGHHAPPVVILAGHEDRACCP